VPRAGFDIPLALVRRPEDGTPVPVRHELGL
jgi:hypothetical protein